jgi:hypothetical protein
LDSCPFPADDACWRKRENRTARGELSVGLPNSLLGCHWTVGNHRRPAMQFDCCTAQICAKRDEA